MGESSDNKHALTEDPNSVCRGHAMFSDMEIEAWYESRQVYEPPGHERDSVWLEKELKRIQRERQRLERERSKFLEREQK